MIATREDACAAVLSAILLAPDTLDTVAAEYGLRPEHFWQPTHQAAFRGMLALRDDGQPIDPLTLKAHLEAEADSGHGPWANGHPNPKLHACATVDALTAPVPELANLHGYARIVRNEAEWDTRGRALAEASKAIHSRDLDNFTAALATADQAADRPGADIVTTDQLGNEFLDWYDNPTTGAIPTPFDEINNLLAGGFLPGATTVLAAWPGIGKSVLVDQFATHATQHGHRACVYVNEMVRETRTARTIARMTGIKFHKIMRKELDAAERIKIADAAARLPFPLKECAGWSADEIARHIRRHKWDLWAVDLVTRIPANDTRDWDQVSGRLTDIAVQTSSHGILVCQLNLERAKSVVKPPPVGRDLRNTGAWYADATNVMFVHRDQQEARDNTGAPTGIAQMLDDGQIRVEKSRNDQPGGMQVTFNPSRMCFEPLSQYSLRAVA